jgi:hypothetical protein
MQASDQRPDKVVTDMTPKELWRRVSRGAKPMWKALRRLSHAFCGGRRPIGDSPFPSRAWCSRCSPFRLGRLPVPAAARVQGSRLSLGIVLAYWMGLHGWTRTGSRGTRSRRRRRLERQRARSRLGRSWPTSGCAPPPGRLAGPDCWSADRGGSRPAWPRYSAAARVPDEGRPWRSRSPPREVSVRFRVGSVHRVALSAHAEPGPGRDVSDFSLWSSRA